MIALFTDFGTQDAYVAQMKGVIVSIYPAAAILDLSHEIGPFDIRQAAYLLDRSACYFPAGTIFVAVVDPGVGSTRRPLLLHTGADKYYVGPDNGLFSRVLAREGLRSAFQLEVTAYFRTPDASMTFHGRDIFGPVAAYLERGMAPASFGRMVHDLVTLPPPQLRAEGRRICGEVLHIDHFGNMLTNIRSAMLPQALPGACLTVSIRGRTEVVPFCRTYAEGPLEGRMGLVSSNDEFEIAQRQGRAVDAFAARAGDAVELEY